VYTGSDFNDIVIKYQTCHMDLSFFVVRNEKHLERVLECFGAENDVDDE
jgi:hypothetical protein